MGGKAKLPWLWLRIFKTSREKRKGKNKKYSKTWSLCKIRRSCHLISTLNAYIATAVKLDSSTSVGLTTL